MSILYSKIVNTFKILCIWPWTTYPNYFPAFFPWKPLPLTVHNSVFLPFTFCWHCYCFLGSLYDWIPYLFKGPLKCHLFHKTFCDPCSDIDLWAVITLYLRSLFIFYLLKELFESIVALLLDYRFCKEGVYSWFIFTCCQRSPNNGLWVVCSQRRIIDSWRERQLAYKKGKKECFVELLVCLVAYSFIYVFTPYHMSGIVLGTGDKTRYMGAMIRRGTCAQSIMFCDCQF